MWPGFGDNMRVLEWIVNRVAGKVEVQPTAIGDMPKTEDFNFYGMDFNDNDLNKLLTVDVEAWNNEIQEVQQYLDSFGSRVPKALYEELEKTKSNLT